MRSRLVIIAPLAFVSLGYAIGQSTHQQKNSPMKKVTGIGGVFFKSKDPKALREWYRDHLGIAANQYGASFEWKELDGAKKGVTQWAPFKDNTDYFGSGKQDFMINYRVEDLDALVKELTMGGVTIVDTIQDSEYGKFIHIIDLDGNRVELWEPKGE